MLGMLDCLWSNVPSVGLYYRRVDTHNVKARQLPLGLETRLLRVQGVIG
jgi:hypothetical protein